MIGWMAYDERFSAADGMGALLICAALFYPLARPRGLQPPRRSPMTPQ